MSDRIRHHAGLGLALLAALLQALAMPVAHGRVARASLEVCTAQGVRSVPADVPTIPRAAREHGNCALCLQPGTAAGPAPPFVLHAGEPGGTTAHLADALARAPLPFTLRGARAPPAASLS